MTLKKYLFLMTIATLLCWGALGLILIFVNPYEAGLLGLLFFYSTLFLGLSGVFSIIGFVLRYLIKRNEFAYQQVKTAFRQGLMFALLIVTALILQGFKLLVWWNLLLLIILLGGVEYFFVMSEIKNKE
jgi:hypothetical protein